MKSVYLLMPSGCISSTGLLLFWLGTIAPATAQIIPDRTLPNNTQVVQEGDRFVITEGTQAGSNLFHSFQDFSLGTGETATFDRISPDIANVISRVTGANLSDIDGAIEVLQTNSEVSQANFFLINPNGIVFGENASLNVGGSFLATTANQIEFADGTEFRADGTQSSPLLTVSVPIGLQLGQNSGEIVNRSLAPLVDRFGEVVPDPNNPDEALFGGLQVPSGETLALVGGSIFIDEGIITVSEGRVELGGVANGRVSIAQTGEGWRLGYEAVDTFDDVLLDFAFIDTSGTRSGSIQIQGESVRLVNESFIVAETEDRDGGEVLLGASQVTIDDFSQITTDTRGVGRGGNLTVEVDRLVLRNGGQLTSTTFDVGDAGTLTVVASDAVEIDGGQIVAGQWFPSGLSTEVRSNATGNGGNLSIATENLRVTHGGQVSTSTSSGGNAGILDIAASQIEVTGAALTEEGNLFRDIDDGFPRRSGLFTSTDIGSSGNGNRLQITTERLTLRDGAVIRTGTLGSGNGGDLTITASEFVEVSGTDLEGSTPTLLFAASGGIPGVEDFNFPEATGDGGTINLQTGELRVRDGGTIAVGSLNQRENVQAGELQIRADSVRLDGGSFRGETRSGDGGNIEIDVADVLQLQNNSLISTTAGTAQTGGNGGDIAIETPNGFIVASQNSDITANAFAGRGGNINITAQALFGIQPRNRLTDRSDITATSQLNTDGQINIDTPDLDPTQGLANLPDAPGVPETLQGCDARRGRNSRFINGGRGGLPPVPMEPLETNDILEDIHPPPHWGDRSPASEWNGGDRIVEATGWIVNENGDVVLVAEMPAREEGCGV